ncbi:MAG: hypothetical protein L0J18_09985, partial [Tetragenococcus koreensis]|nr:hypothetical protein [Tetragenococcus koreensis]
IMKRRRFLMALKDTLNQQKAEIPQPDNQEATSQDLQQLIQVLTEIRNYSGATLQQKSLEKANLENNLQEIQEVTNSVLNSFNSSLTNLETTQTDFNETAQKQSIESLNRLKTILNDLLEQNKTEIAKIQSEMSQNNQQLSEINQTITKTMDQVFNQLNAEIKRTNQRLTFRTVLTNLYASVPTGIVVVALMWLLNYFNVW